MLPDAHIPLDGENLLRRCNDITHALIAAGHGRFLLQTLEAASSRDHDHERHSTEPTTTNSAALLIRGSPVSAFDPQPTITTSGFVQPGSTLDNIDNDALSGPHEPTTATIGTESPEPPDASTIPSSAIPGQRHASPEALGASASLPPPSTPTKRRSQSPCRPARPPPAPRAPRECFWTASVQKMQVYNESPWEFYIPFLTLKAEHTVERTLALCNNGTEIRVIKTALSNANIENDLFEIQHQNFIDLYGIYRFEGQSFLVLEYMAFSLKELLHNAIFPTELEIAYIIGQVGFKSILSSS
jgi:hypothetical protein